MQCNATPPQLVTEQTEFISFNLRYNISRTCFFQLELEGAPEVPVGTGIGSRDFGTFSSGTTWNSEIRTQIVPVQVLTS